RVDSAELQHAFRAVGKMTEHRQQVRHNQFIALPNRMQEFSAREYTGNVAKPTLEHFDINPESEDLQPADLDPLPPVGRGVGIQIGAGETLKADMMGPSEIVFRQQFFDGKITL